ncbi:hypothetical protein DL240_00235 [Lujinxingia litoralis]|uniref:Protein kinase domain-containing protein n=1 Tax=Lujinxingia litoralis TaxID=2211119 RepID=A0A328C987_9DELT|nr:serine/threonine-protein kinase [Lujinxingia litoralis]RAL24672.1 hypothetical protein DL240_00235 [Lujinxingia litoralis]
MNSIDATLPEAGDLIGGRFRILEVLGTGGFGTVYRAVQENIGRDVALKFLTPVVAKDPINVERFRREAFHVSQLRHPNTITLYDYGQTEDGLAYMVMEFLEGDALGDVIQTQGALGWPRAAHVYIQVLKSLSEAHRRGLVHRDLKPENIFLCEMFGERDYVKVLDFGVAKMTLADSDDDPDGEEALTRAGRIFGTPLYMAPEQACAEPITPATDVYALGLLLYEMVSGQPPVTGRNRMDVIHKQIRDQVPELPPELEQTPVGRLIRRACEKDPLARYQDAAALLDGFLDAIQAMQIRPTPQGGGSRPEISASHIVPMEVQRAFGHTSTTEETSQASDAVVQTTPDAVAATESAELDATHLIEPPKPRAEPPPLPRGAPRVEIKRISRKVPAPAEAARPSFPFQTRAHSRPRFDLPLIGRDREFDTLVGLVKSAGQLGSGQVVLLEGEGGVGKTHLVHAVMSALSETPVSYSTAAFRRRSLPLEALREAIGGLWGVSHSERMQVDSTVRQDLRSLGGFSDGEIGAIVDFLRPRVMEPSELAASESGVLFARLERLLLRMAERRPLVLALEDIQYADSASLGFLEYFAVTMRTQACPVVLMLTMRPEERGLNPDLEDHLRTIGANVGVSFSRQRLRRLRGKALSVFLDSILPLERRLKERVGWLSQGVPLHAIQIIRYLQNENNLQKAGERWRLKSGNPRKIELPPDLMELMALRVEQAIHKHRDRPQLRRVLEWLSVLGMRVPVDLLKAALTRLEGHDVSQLELDLGALSEEAIARQGVHQNLICVEFENSLLREAMLKELREQWSTRGMHQGAAELKQAFYGERQLEVPLVEIADHWRQAGDSDRYRDSLSGAAKRSMARFDLRGARDRYRELLGLLERRGDHGELWTESNLAMAELARRFGEFGLSEEHYRRVVEGGHARGPERSRALRGFGHLLTIQSRSDEATHYYSQALDHSQQIGDVAGVAKALIGLSRVHLIRGDALAGQQVREQLETMTGTLGDAEVTGQVLLHLAEASQRRGDHDERYAYLKRARRAFESSRNRQGLSDALIALGGALMAPSLNAPDRFAQAEQTLRDALELKRAIGDRHGLAEAFRQLGQLKLEIEDYDQAEGLLRQGLNIHQALGTPFNIGAAQNGMGILMVMTRRYAQAEQHFDAAIEVFERIGDQVMISQPLLNKGIVLINQRRFNEAQTVLREARRLKENLGTNWGLFDLRNNLALVDMWHGELESAEHNLSETLKHVDAQGTAEDRAKARSLMGLLQCFLSRLQLAALELGRARADAEDLGMPRVTVFCQANAAFYALLTESTSAYETLIVEAEKQPLLAELDREVWLDLLGQLARHSAEQTPSRQAARQLRAVATVWKRFGRVEQISALLKQADLLDVEFAPRG